MWYEFSVKFETDHELTPGEFRVFDVVLALRNSLNTMGIPAEFFDQISLVPIRTEQESRLAHPSSKSL